MAKALESCREAIDVAREALAILKRFAHVDAYSLSRKFGDEEIYLLRVKRELMSIESVDDDFGDE